MLVVKHAFVFIDYACALPGEVLCSMLLCLLYTIKCGMSLTVSVQNSFESGKSVIVRLTHPIKAY